MWRNEWTATTRKNACNRETMMKIRITTIFAITQVALAREHASRRSIVNTLDRAVRCNRNIVTNSLSNKRCQDGPIIQLKLQKEVVFEEIISYVMKLKLNMIRDAVVCCFSFVLLGF